MSSIHSNPEGSRRDTRTGVQVTARAPYNFVPLPDTVVAAPERVDQDQYQPGTLTGRIVCQLTTCSPTYIRGMLTAARWAAIGQKKPDAMSVDEKKEKAPFFSRFQTQNGQPGVPELPGSSLRGMVRQMVEVISQAHMRWVADEPTFMFRAVAAPGDDPLRDPYRDLIGAFARNVKAGYLHQDSKKENWFVRPAQAPRQHNWPEKGAFLKVKERRIPDGAVTGLLRFDDPDYEPGYYEVTFDVAVQSGRQGKYLAITQIGDKGKGYPHHGVLVTSGNMLETGNPGQKSPRKNHALVLPEDRKAGELPLSPQV
ncbi:MAG: hypothetical protein KDE28_05505, partial [Anaerolineales bacterium]|nr:hypothetical protein [Anaerolineales bacterium]